MGEHININVNILSFGQMQLMFKSSKRKIEKEEMPAYTGPRSTNIERIEILYEGGREYKVPKTTDGR